MKQLTHLLSPCIKHQFGINENTAPRTSNDKHSRTLIDNIQITQEDIDKDLNEGRE